MIVFDDIGGPIHILLIHEIIIGKDGRDELEEVLAESNKIVLH